MKTRRIYRPSPIIGYTKSRNTLAWRKSRWNEFIKSTEGEEDNRRKKIEFKLFSKFILHRHDENRHRRPHNNRKNNNIRRKSSNHDSDDEAPPKIQTNNIPEYESPDCMVSEWNSWSDCSKSCGLGEKFRNRTIVKAPKKGGGPCPQLTERSWCGSSRCKPSLINENIGNSSYFKW